MILIHYVESNILMPVPFCCGAIDGQVFFFPTNNDIEVCTVSGVNYKDREYLEEFYNNPREDMIDRIVEIVVQRKPDVYGSFILDRSTILNQIANFKSLINQ